MNGSLYYYGMRLRGFSPGCQPMDGFVICCTNFVHSHGYHDVLIYRRELTEDELRDYELDFIKEVEYPG